MRLVRTTLLTLGLICGVASPGTPAGPAVDPATLGFGERLASQEAVLRVMAAHAGVAPSNFETRVPRAVIDAGVRSTLAESRALEVLWNTPITREMLDAEVLRMVRGSVMPGRLRERFAALGDDPRLIREIVARPVLADRLVHDFYAWDRRMHRETWNEAEELRRRLAEGRMDPWAASARRTEVEIDSPSLREGPDGVVRLGTPGPIQEDAERLTIDVALEPRGGRFLVARYALDKRSWADWWIENQRRFATESIDTPGMAQSAVAARDPSVPARASSADRAGLELDLARLEAGASCTPDTWSVLHGGAPDALSDFAAVWTGTLMLVWGGHQQKPGWRYDPALDTWSPMSTNGAPPVAAYPAGVWTGSKMIVWGGTRSGVGPVGTGGVYDPVADAWTPVTSVGAPTGRYAHTAVWTGTRMIIWGGFTAPATDETNTGALYDPALDQWTPTAVSGAPYQREDHTAVWTGHEMIIWGGCVGGTLCFGEGGRYDPATDSWIPVTPLGAPEGRSGHTAVWTGTQLIVWGGETWNGALLSTGGRYDPAVGWSATSNSGTPSPRRDHTAIWTGAEMIIWGGTSQVGAIGSARYKPASDSWSSISGGPEGRFGHAAVWTGTRMIVWGGSNGASPALLTGGRYDPNVGWTPTSVGTQPSSVGNLFWTGNEILSWSGGVTGRYDPATDSWRAVTTPAGMVRAGASAVWTGSRMVVWGGSTVACCQCGQNYNVYYDTGRAYDPLLDFWTPGSIGSGALFKPTKRAGHRAVWNGFDMIVWGGVEQLPCSGGTLYKDGARYNPTYDTWQPIATAGAPAPGASTAYTDGFSTELGALFWNGSMGGYIYSPDSDSWTRAEPVALPSSASAEYAGGRLVVVNQQGAGSRYDPITDRWSPTTPVNTDPVCNIGVVGTSGSQIFWWGGGGGSDCLGATDHGARYDPLADLWVPTPSTDAPPASRTSQVAVWNGQQVMWWDATAHHGFAYCMPGRGPCYRDQDGDGYGDLGASAQCNEPGVAWRYAPDCDDSDPTRGGLAGEVDGLAFTDSSNLVWSAPAVPAGVSFFYDVLRSNRPDDLPAAACVATDITTLSATDLAVPPPGAVTYYHVRASTCPGGALEGTLGKGTPGTPARIGPVCP
jgi:hypothetical protein